MNKIGDNAEASAQPFAGRTQPFANSEISAESAAINTNRSIQPGTGAIADSAPSVSSRSLKKTPGVNTNITTPPPRIPEAQQKASPAGAVGAAGGVVSAFGRRGGVIGAATNLASEDVPGAVSNVARAVSPKLNVFSRALDAGKKLIKGNPVGAGLEMAGAVVPVVPDLINTGKDFINQIDEQAEQNRQFNKRNREVRGSLEARNTGIADVDGNIFVNTNDAVLLDKLGFEVADYDLLEKTSEVLDLYSYIEKVAEVPREVAKLIDEGKAFSAEYLKEMEYNVPKGYEVKGDLCCPSEKTEKEKKRLSEKTASIQKQAVNFGQIAKAIGAGVNKIAPTVANAVHSAAPAAAKQKAIVKQFQDPSKIGFKSVYPTEPVMPAGTNPKKWRADVAEGMQQHQTLSRIRQDSSGHQAAFSFNAPNSSGVDELHNVWVHPEMIHTNQQGKGLAAHDRQLVNALIENTQTGQKWAQPMYRSTGTNSEHTVGQWLPTRGFGAPSEDWVNAVKTKINPEFEMPQPVPGVLPQFVGPSNQGPGGLKGPGWLGKYQFNPSTQQWMVHDKTDAGVNALMPVYQRLREAMGEYMGNIGLAKQGSEKSASESKPGLWANIHAKRKRGEKAAKPGDEDYPDKKQWDKLSKKGEADPEQSILISGHSGAGKSTLAKELSKLLDMNLRRVDAHKGFSDYVKKDHEHWEKSLSAGTKEYERFNKIINNANRHVLRNAPEASIIEGTQLGHLSPEELSKFKAHILVGGTPEQSIMQRIARSAKKKGVEFSPEEIEARRIKAKKVVDFWEPGIEKFRKLPGTLQYNHTEHEVEPLVEQLRALMSKQAASAAWQRSEGKNPEGGLNAKGRASYKKQTGGTLKAPVTESNPSGERAKRQNSFCSRMCGMKSKNTGSKAQSDPDSRINKSLRKWNCKCGEDHSSLFEKIACNFKEAKSRCWEGYEPVPGKDPYSEDSCRPKGKKKKIEKNASTAWKKRLRTGKLSVDGVNAILRSSGLSSTMSPESWHKSLSDPRYSKGILYGHRERGKSENVFNRKYTVQPFSEQEHLDRLARTNLGSLAREAAWRHPDSIYPYYKAHMMDTRAGQDAQAVKETINELSYDSKQKRYMRILQKMYDKREKMPTSRKKFLSDSSDYPRENWRGMSLQQANDLLDSAGQTGNHGPQAVPDLNTIAGPVGVGQPITRHEISHLVDRNMPQAQRLAVLKELHQTLKRNPEVMRGILRYKDPTKAISESFAQLIGSRGNSNSAKRFIDSYVDAAKNSKIWDMQQILPKLLERDPSGRDAAVVSQLIRRYGLRLPDYARHQGALPL
jgi:hypothetical protein